VAAICWRAAYPALTNSSFIGIGRDLETMISSREPSMATSGARIDPPTCDPHAAQSRATSGPRLGRTRTAVRERLTPPRLTHDGEVLFCAPKRAAVRSDCPTTFLSADTSKADR
jgi:hypothetical protein